MKRVRTHSVSMRVNTHYQHAFSTQKISNHKTPGTIKPTRAHNFVSFHTSDCVNGKIGHIQLQRPKAYNALNHAMTQAIAQQLSLWAQEIAIKAVVVYTKGAHFCAGGDLRQIHQLGSQSPQKAHVFATDEYRLNQQIIDYPKPYIALVHGITMGGGAGLSVHASHVIGAENLQFAMPEVRIGFFPDVGMSYYLARLPDRIGYYLALTGNKIGISDAMHLNLVDFYLPHSAFPQLIQQLNQQSLDGSKAQITEYLQEYSKQLRAKPPPPSSLQACSLAIKRCFSCTSLPEILRALQQSGDWGQTIAKTLQSNAPTSVHVAYQQLQYAALCTVSDCLVNDTNLAYHFFNDDDLYEGIRAAILDKDNQPGWRPAQLDAVTETTIHRYFTKPPVSG